MGRIKYRKCTRGSVVKSRFFFFIAYDEYQGMHVRQGVCMNVHAHAWGCVYTLH